MPEPLTDSIQDYLKSIYDLTEDGQPASTNALAARLRIKPASVTGMLQKLAAAKPPLVDYHKHQGVRLTAKGRRAALEVIRHHRLLEAWLVQSLGYSWDEVHNEAEKLEHVISEDFENRIANALGNPSRDPHGDLIPTTDLTMPEDVSTRLSSLRPTQSAIIQRVKTDNVELLRYLEGLGMLPGTKVEIIDFSPYDNNVTIKVGDHTAVLGPAITKFVFVGTL
jgi:DtxR family transcriptional regulator, Mn-dependent transcriptional regulator